MISTVGSFSLAQKSPNVLYISESGDKKTKYTHSVHQHMTVQADVLTRAASRQTSH